MLFPKMLKKSKRRASKLEGQLNDVISNDVGEEQVEKTFVAVLKDASRCLFRFQTMS
jgi:hypothetical protein